MNDSVCKKCHGDHTMIKDIFEFWEENGLNS